MKRIKLLDITTNFICISAFILFYLGIINTLKPDIFIQNYLWLISVLSGFYISELYIIKYKYSKKVNKNYFNTIFNFSICLLLCFYANEYHKNFEFYNRIFFIFKYVDAKWFCIIISLFVPKRNYN